MIKEFNEFVKREIGKRKKLIPVSNKIINLVSNYSYEEQMIILKSLIKSRNKLKKLEKVIK